MVVSYTGTELAQIIEDGKRDSEWWVAFDAWRERTDPYRCMPIGKAIDMYFVYLDYRAACEKDIHTEPSPYCHD